jgi:hypothetical protein
MTWHYIMQVASLDSMFAPPTSCMRILISRAKLAKREKAVIVKGTWPDQLEENQITEKRRYGL